MTININTIYTTAKLKGDSSSGISTSTTYYGVRYLCEKPVVDTTAGTIQYTIYFQPYLENDSSYNRWDTESPSSGNVSYFRIDGVTYNFWIKYDLSANGNKQFLTNSSNNSEFWIQNASSASSNIIDVSRIFNQTGARGLKYVFSVAIDSIGADQTSIIKTISYKITPPTGGSDGFKGTSNTSISIELPLPDFLSVPTGFSAVADYTYNGIGVFKSNTSTSSIELNWTAPTVNGTNTVANYILRYAISSTNNIPSTLSSSISLDTTNNSIDISNAAFKSVLNSISEGQYLFVAIQVVGTEFTKNEYSNIITLRKNIRPSAPIITGSTYYDNNYNVTFTIKAQNGVINTSACNFSYGSEKGVSAGTYTYTFGSNDSMALTFYAEDGLGDKSEGIVVNYSPQSTLNLTLEPNMAKVINNIYAAVMNSFDYTITGGSGPYTISLKIANTQIVSFTTSYSSNTYNFSIPLNVLNYGVSRGIDYNITMTVSDSTNASSSVSKTYKVPALSFTITAVGEAEGTNFNKEIDYTYNTTGTSMGYSVIYNGKTINLNNTGRGVFSVTNIPYGASTNFIFRAQDQLGLYVTNTVELTRISASDAPPTPMDFTIDITSLYTLKPLSKRLIASNNTEDEEINATWYNEKNGKKYKIYVVYGIYEIEVATVQSSGSGDTASSTIEIDDDFFKNFINTHSNSTISGQFRMYGYDETYGFSDTYATATSSTNINNPLNFTISFQEAPKFATGSSIITFGISSIYGQSTIPNPGDTISLRFPAAEDYNNNTIFYRIYEEISNNSIVVDSHIYNPEIILSGSECTTSFVVSDNIYENNSYSIKVIPYTIYGSGEPLVYAPEGLYKGRVTNPSFEVVSSSVDGSDNLTINCKFNDKGGNNKGVNNFRSDFRYTIYINDTSNGSAITDTFSITVSDYTQSTPLVIKLVGYAANNNQQQVTSSLSYIHYLAEPTVAYRKNYLGINTSTPEGVDVIIDIRAYNNYEKVKLVGPTKTITINLSDGSIDGAIISGGEWVSDKI